MSSLYTTGTDVEVVRRAVASLIHGAFDVEEATEFEGFTIAIDLLDLYDAKVVARYLSGDLKRPVVTMEELSRRETLAS